LGDDVINDSPIWDSPRDHSNRYDFGIESFNGDQVNMGIVSQSLPLAETDIFSFKVPIVLRFLPKIVMFQQIKTTI
jgi:hypothetical protein